MDYLFPAYKRKMESLSLLIVMEIVGRNEIDYLKLFVGSVAC